MKNGQPYRLGMITIYKYLLAYQILFQFRGIVARDVPSYLDKRKDLGANIFSNSARFFCEAG
jgi:hypothetical protein